MTPQVSNVLRILLKIIGTICAYHGATKAAAIVNSEDVLGLVMAIGGVAWSLLSNTDKAIIQRAADAIPAGTVVPATTDSAPKAQVLTPESATEFIRKPQTANTPTP